MNGTVAGLSPGLSAKRSRGQNSRPRATVREGKLHDVVRWFKTWEERNPTQNGRREGGAET